MKREGTVSWFNWKKGFGFITDQDGEDVFVSYTEIRRDGFKTLEAGERVRFELLQDGGHGKKAAEVELLS